MKRYIVHVVGKDNTKGSVWIYKAKNDKELAKILWAEWQDAIDLIDGFDYDTLKEFKKSGMLCGNWYGIEALKEDAEKGYL